MKGLVFIDYFAIIASVLTIISFCINIYQCRSRKQFLKALKSRSQAAYNYFYQIALHSDSIRSLEASKEPPEKRLTTATKGASSINSIADAARNDIISYSREHLNFIPQEEHPRKPFEGVLPKPKKPHNWFSRIFDRHQEQKANHP